MVVGRELYLRKRGAPALWWCQKEGKGISLLPTKKFWDVHHWSTVTRITISGYLWPGLKHVMAWQSEASHHQGTIRASEATCKNMLLHEIVDNYYQHTFTETVA